jgi:hypothetical protein
MYKTYPIRLFPIWCLMIFVFLVLLTACDQPQKAEDMDKLLKVDVSEKMIIWPVIMEVLVDDELTECHRILLYFVPTKDNVGRTQFLYLRHKSKKIFTGDGDGYAMPVVHADNLSLDMVDDDSDSTRFWQTGVELGMYFSDGPISYADQYGIQSSAHAQLRYFEKSVAVKNDYWDKKLYWKLPEIRYVKKRKMISGISSSEITVKMYANAFTQ